MILGVTFKKDTDDLRNSPSVSLINLLNNTQSKNIRVYDPNLENLDSTLIKIYFNPELIINDLRDGLNKSKIICLMLNYNQFVDEMFNVNNKIIIDFCKIKFDLNKTNKYYGINW